MSDLSQSRTSGEVRLGTPTERALYRDCVKLKAECDRLRGFVELVATHKLVPGVYADDEHPYDEWVTPDDAEMEFDHLVERARELLR